VFVLSYHSRLCRAKNTRLGIHFLTQKKSLSECLRAGFLVLSFGRNRAIKAELGNGKKSIELFLCCGV
jgi:hypothetical protein